MNPTKLSIRLFYSYSHNDSNYRERMETILKLLEENAGLKQWSDRCILPGQSIPEKIKQNMQKADILVFLVSDSFLASNECKKEWHYAKKLAENKNQTRIPVIIKNCAWQDFDDMQSLMASPVDGKPVAKFGNQDDAWQQVYEGIKNVIENFRICFKIKQEYVDEITKVEFISQQKQDIMLNDLFVFPSLSYDSDHDPGYDVDGIDQILSKKYALINGDDLSGKTALCIHMFLSVVKDEKPVMFVDLKSIEGEKPSMKVYQEIYEEQFQGDFCLWKEQEGITVILDNLSSSSNSINHIIFVKEHFDHVAVTVSSDIYNAYWNDDSRLADFTSFKINRLSHVKQEKLIRKWAELSNQSTSISDGMIDQMEDKINSIIINNRIVPRYPFYILTILQLGEGFMPQDLNITAYGHCYYILILAHLLKSGIQKEDSEINSCINFASHFAFYIYKRDHNRPTVTDKEFEDFLNDYKTKYVIKSSTIKRLQNIEYGIIREWKFKNPYIYYYFLGKHLSDNSANCKDIIDAMAEESYVTTNRLTLIFLIHHSHDTAIIDDILLRTMLSLEELKPAILNHEQTKIFKGLIKDIPKDIISDNIVEKERRQEREALDSIGSEADDDLVKEDLYRAVNDIYRILKNNEILGQILRNKYGSLEKNRLREIIETITDGGLRIVTLFLLDQEQINGVAQFIHQRNPKLDLQRIRVEVQALIFMSTIVQLEIIAATINKPAIRKVVEEVVDSHSTPAYDLIGYFALLESSEDFEETENKHLGELLTSHDKDDVIKRIVSLRTQIYMNTHKVKEGIAQSVYSKLEIKYRKRLIH